jgi:transposase
MTEHHALRIPSAPGYVPAAPASRKFPTQPQVGTAATSSEAVQEGTGSYGAALARHLRGKGVKVIEVDPPDRRQRRAKGKSDRLDAYAAADAVLSGRARTLPKAGN